MKIDVSKYIDVAAVVKEMYEKDPRPYTTEEIVAAMDGSAIEKMVGSIIEDTMYGRDGYGVIMPVRAKDWSDDITGWVPSEHKDKHRNGRKHWPSTGPYV